LPNEILYNIFYILPIHDRWRMRVNKKLHEIEAKAPTRKLDVVSIESEARYLYSAGWAMMTGPRSENDDGFLLRLKKLSNYKCQSLNVRISLESDAYRNSVVDLIKDIKADTLDINRHMITREIDLLKLIENKKMLRIDSKDRRNVIPMYFRLIKAMYVGSVQLETFANFCMDEDVWKCLNFLIHRDKDFGPHYTYDIENNFVYIEDTKSRFFLSMGFRKEYDAYCSRSDLNRKN
ncbi:hypothetical protein PFISCL1PPCAC_18982, partial [Pristionchus fissidentatus]